MAKAAANMRKAPASEQRLTGFLPISINEEARTVEAVFATETPVPRVGWDGAFNEVLRCDPASVVVTRLKGAPVLDSHDRTSVLSIMGRVLEAHLDKGRLIGTIEFAKGERGDHAFELAKAGMLSKVSVGYRILKASQTDQKDGSSLITVTRWEPYEISLVSVPADHNATIRGVSAMDPEDEVIDDVTQQQTRQQPVANASFTRQLSDLRQNAIDAGLASATVDAELEGIRSITGARTAVFNMLADRTRQTRTLPYQGGDRQDVSAVDDQIIDAIAVRLGAPSQVENNPMIGRTVEEYGRSFYESRGFNIRGIGANRIAEAMLGDIRVLGSPENIRAAHSTSDFTFLMDNGFNRAALARYQATPSPLKTLAMKRNQPDFRVRKFIRPGEAMKLRPIQEDGEIKYGTFKEDGAGLAIKSYGVAFSITRQALINDDLNLIGDYINNFADSAAETEGDLLYGILSDNSGMGAKMSDGKSMIHVDHGNLAAVGSVPDIANVSIARTAMRTQKNVNGTGTAGVTPAILLVGPNRETLAQQLAAAINAQNVASVNPFGGNLTVMVENRYQGMGWWLFGDPVTRPALMYGYLDGYEGPRVRTDQPFGRQGLSCSCELDFGCAPMDYRAVYFNPGA